MNGQDINGIIDEVCAFVINQGEWTTKPYQNELVNKLYCYIGLKKFGFHSFCSIISSYQNIFIFNGPINKLNGPKEVQAPFHKSFSLQSGNQCGQVHGG